MRVNKAILFCLSLLPALAVFNHISAQGGSIHVHNSNCLATAFEANHNTADDPWAKSDLIGPEELARSLSDKEKRVILQMGIIHLYKLSHIPGAKFIGPGSDAESLTKLKKELQDVPRTTEIVYYCGCCPWGDCPNIRPPYNAIREMGFRKVRVLNLPTSFVADWVTKGLPVEKGGA
ncbi:MAG: rhodanese-like domain-containing protein [Blastocatellia bacterium]